MAEASISVAQDQFSCPICLDLLKHPVTIPCGHSYCMNCITDCWNQDDQKGIYSCPQCRQTFTTRPALGKNTILAEVVEKLKTTNIQTVSPALSFAGPGDVECDVCSGRKYKAIKSCLLCLESYCQTHFEHHEAFCTGKRHKITDATGIQEMICPLHDKLMEVYCRTDQKCICLLCTMDEHKNHDNVSSTSERTEKQKQLEDTQRNLQQRIQEREKELLNLKEAVETHKRSAQAAVEDSERIFTEMISSIERSHSEVIKMIRDREKTEVSRAEGLLKQLEQEIDALRRRDAELKQLLHTDNHINFLQSFQSLSGLPGSTESVNISSLLSFDDVGKSVSQLTEKLEDFCKVETEQIIDTITYINIVPTTEPKTREEFLQYSRHLTMNANTVNKTIQLSEENRVATCSKNVQSYPNHPDRFDFYYEVLCSKSVCGRCYWEVEWSGTDNVGISVSYKSIKRRGHINECGFGLNDLSWKLSCNPSSCSFWHNNKETKLSVVSRFSRIGVYVDHRAGILSFYSVSDTMTLIHRVQTTFTQPLYPGFWLNLGSSVKLNYLAK